MRNDAVVRESRALKLRRAEESPQSQFSLLGEEQVAVEVARSCNKLERTKSMISVAVQVAKLREESERLTTNQAAQGVVLISDVRQATAANYKAKAELIQARLGYLLAWAELEPTAGRRGAPLSSTLWWRCATIRTPAAGSGAVASVSRFGGELSAKRSGQCLPFL